MLSRIWWWWWWCPSRFQVNQLKRPAISNLLDASWSIWCGRPLHRLSFVGIGIRSTDAKHVPQYPPKFNSEFTPEKSPSQKGKDRLPTIIFQGRAVNFQGCIQLKSFGWYLINWNAEPPQNWLLNKIFGGFEGIASQLHPHNIVSLERSLQKRNLEISSTRCWPRSLDRMASNLENLLHFDVAWSSCTFFWGVGGKIIRYFWDMRIHGDVTPSIERFFEENLLGCWTYSSYLRNRLEMDVLPPDWTQPSVWTYRIAVSKLGAVQMDR